MPIVLGSKEMGRCKFCGGIIVRGEFSHRGWRIDGEEWYVCVDCKKRRRLLNKISVA